MVSLGPGMMPRVSARYKHMMPEDRRIWTRFIANGTHVPKMVWYDVRVGEAMEVPSGRPEWMKRFAEYATRKRIDVVARSGLDYWIIECKPHAGVVALGQIVYYSVAFMKDYQPSGLVIPCVVTDVCDSDVRPLFELVGAVVFEVGVV